MKIGLIGYGRLGKLAAHYLGQDCDLIVYDQSGDYQGHNPKRVKPSSLEEVCQAPIVILAVPISQLADLCRSISSLLEERTLVVDVCSVKVKPMEQMNELLPKHVQILGTHPMFGPDSAAKTVFGSKIVLCPQRIEAELLRNIRNYLETHGLKVIEVDPHEHDRQMSSSLLMTHMIGRTLMQLQAKELEIDTKGYRRLMKILEVVENDSWQLFKDMNDYNPYASSMREDFVQALQEVIERVK